MADDRIFPGNGIRRRFFSDVRQDYTDEKEASFLYKFFQSENLSRALQNKFFADGGEALCLNDADRIKSLMKKRPAEAKKLLLREQQKSERGDLFEGLCLRDMGYEAGVISDTEYYEWLVVYLSAHDKAYSDASVPDSHSCLRPLIEAGLGRPAGDLNKRRTDEALNELCGEIGESAVRERLCGLKAPDGGDYLPWLTKQLRRTAVHIRVKTYLQDSGFPIRELRASGKPSSGERKQDFSMRLFEAWCESAKGYDFSMKKRRERTASQYVFHLCAPDDIEKLGRLTAALSGEKYLGREFFIPLVTDTLSGCVLAAVGKKNYEKLYYMKTQQEVFRRGETVSSLALIDYRTSGRNFCFDYLRRAEYTSGVPCRLTPSFHLNAGKDFGQVLEEFKIYCNELRCDDERPPEFDDVLNIFF